MSFLSYSKHFHGPADIMLRDPTRYLAFAQLLNSTMSDDSELTKPQREMIALYCSRLNRCGYCVETHSSILTGLGIDEAEVNALANSAMEPLDDDLRQILAIAGKLTLEPGNVTAADIEAVRASGWSDQTINH